MWSDGVDKTNVLCPDAKRVRDNRKPGKERGTVEGLAKQKEQGEGKGKEERRRGRRRREREPSCMNHIYRIGRGYVEGEQNEPKCGRRRPKVSSDED